MTATYDAAWYDEVMVADGSLAMLPLEDSPWLPVYEALAALIEPHEEVVDLGCGTGRFIALLRKRGHYAAITGIDFSLATIAEAQRYTRGDAAFHTGDLADWRPDPERAGNTVYVCSEVLEHLDDDIELVRRIPPGHRLLFTVPNFESLAHVRIFTGVRDIWERYGGLLTFRSWRLIGDERKAIHVVEAVRRLDSW